jgi:hypothetical protein
LMNAAVLSIDVNSLPLLVTVAMEDD